MINGISVKICGIASAADAQAAAAIGADYVGFIFYPNSPRCISAAKYDAMKAQLPAVKKVAVLVDPSMVDLAALGVMGFDYFQIHFQLSTPLTRVQEWSEVVKPATLWLVPQLPPELDVPPELIALADTFLLDTYHAGKFGGTGETGDWMKFQRHQAAHPQKNWILSGGLNPENVAAAIRATGAKFIDVNSGVESLPGVKDHAKLQALAGALCNRTE
jgi:phosphoribosylanthranilate isomerase